MGLRANRPAPAAPAAVQEQAPAAQAAPAQVAQPAAQPAASAPAAYVAPAAAQSQAVAVTPGSVQDLNAGILENIDGMGTGGNFVTVDGSDFLYKSTETRVQSIDIVVSYGKRFYQWVEEYLEEGKKIKKFHNADTKLDDRYKMKIEIRWLEEGAEEGDAPVEFTCSLSTTSAMQFANYITALSKQGLGVGQVWSRMTISRHQRTGTTDRYSRVDFAAFSLETGDPLNITSVSTR